MTKKGLDKTYDELTDPFRKEQTVDFTYDFGWVKIKGIKTFEPKLNVHQYHMFMYDHKDHFSGLRLDWSFSKQALEDGDHTEAELDDHLAKLFEDTLKGDMLDGMYFLLRKQLREDEKWDEFLVNEVDKEFADE